MGLSSFLENLFGKKVVILTPAGVDSIRINHVKEEIKRSIVYA
jgi:predicted nucleotidyltransferase